MTSSAAPGPPHVFPHLLSCLQTWRPTFWYVMFFITREPFAITFALLRFYFSFSSSLHQLCGCRVFWTPEIQMVLPSITFSQGNVTSCLSPTAECCTVATRKLLSAAPYQKELPQLVALRMLSLTPPQYEFKSLGGIVPAPKPKDHGLGYNTPCNPSHWKTAGWLHHLTTTITNSIPAAIQQHYFTPPEWERSDCWPTAFTARILQF